MTADGVSSWCEGFRPDPNYTISQWADTHRMLSQKGAAEPGLWRTSRTPYLREMMDALSPQDPCQRVVFIKPSQIGSTECGNNFIGFVVHHAPGPMLLIEPTLSDIKKLSRQRLDPMFEESPALKERMAPARSRDGANNLEQKDFRGGTLILTGANSASALASMPIRYLFADEVDRWPHDVEGEGDPLKLAEVRTTTFKSRRKVFICSTPTIRGMSRIEREFLIGDQRYFFVPCPHCGHMQTLRWRDADGTKRLIFDRDEDGRMVPDSAMYLCEECGALIEERHKTDMLAAGEWRATAKGDGVTKSYSLNALYSPLGWYSWDDMAAEFLEAKPHKEKLKTWTNTRLGETWDNAQEIVTVDALAQRLETWSRLEVPAAACVITASADVQGDRIEAKKIAFGPNGEESWLVDYEIFWGDPNTDQTVWHALHEWYRVEHAHASGQMMRASILLVDSGDGNRIDAVYDFVQPHQRERIYAMKGRDFISRPGLAMQSSAKNAHIQLFLVATRAAKTRIMSRLKLERLGEAEFPPGYIHLPGWIPAQYLEQLTNERKEVVQNRRTGELREQYVKSGRVEVLDTEVYCLAGLFVLQTFIAPGIYRDLNRLHVQIMTGQPVGAPARQRGVRSAGVQV